MPSPFGRLVERVANKLAFFPPKPPAYELRRHSDGARELYIHAVSPAYEGAISGCQVLQLKTQRGRCIVAAYVPSRSRKAATLLFSHGNAVDLGQMLPFCRQLTRALDCNMLLYDYTGYGQSSGVLPTVSDTYADIDACLAWLLANGKHKRDIVLYGQSVGSGPSVNLAARTPGFAGVILHSPLCSGMRVLNPKWQWWPQWADVYNNANLIGKVDAPVLIIHGTEDEVVEFAHGKILHSLCKRPAEPLWAVGRNHQDIELDPLYVPRLQGFLSEIFASASISGTANL